MPIPVRCPGCRSTLQVPDQFAGRKGRCKKCQAVFPIPAADTPKEEPPEVLPVDEPRADLDQGHQTAPGLVTPYVLQDDESRDERRRPQGVEGKPRKGNVFLLVTVAAAAFLVVSAGTGVALWWFLDARPAVDDVADPGPLVEINPPAAVAVNAPHDVAPADGPGVIPVERPVAPAGGVRPQALDATREVRPLPSTVADVAVGGGGRYLVLHLPQTRTLALFDVHEARITRYVSLGSDQVRFTAGMTKLVVALPEQNLLQRWDLATGEREVTVPAPADGPIHALVMGSASEGPVLVAQKPEPTFLELQTLKPLPVKHSGEKGSRFEQEAQWRASADGKTFATWGSLVGVHTLLLEGDQAKHYYQDSLAGYLLPSPDGKTIHSARGLFPPEVKQVFGHAQREGPFCLPATQGNLYLTLQGLFSKALFQVNGVPFDPEQKNAPAVSVHLAGDGRTMINLKDLELPRTTHPFGIEVFGVDKRIFLIPSAKRIVTIPTSNDRLVLHHFDLDEALDKSGADYLYVATRAPELARRGADYAYQLAVQSKRGGVRYTLESGPPGLTVSPTGRVTWRVPANFTGPADVSVHVTDASGQELFHAFKVVGSDRPELAAAGAPPAAPDPPPVAPAQPVAPAPQAAPEGNGTAAPILQPPALAQVKVVVQLPAKVTDVAVGGGGRYLVLCLPQQQKLAVFDVNVAQITHYVAAPGGGVRFSAGRTKLVVALPEQNLLQRWDLATGRRELTVPAPAGGPVANLVLGSASEGPILVSQMAERINAESPLSFLDLRTLKALPIQATGERAHRFEEPGLMRASADGKTFARWRTKVSPQGVFLTVLTGGVAKHNYQHENAGHLLPSPNGKVVYSALGMFDPEEKSLTFSRPPGPFCLPAVHGDYYLTLQGLDPFDRFQSTFVGVTDRLDPRQKRNLPPATLHLEGDTQPLVTLRDLELPEETNPWDREALGTDKRVFLIPAAKLLITIPMGDDRRLVLHRFDPDEALEKAGNDYLFVTSRAPASATRGAEYVYQMAVRSKKGGVTYKVQSGPPGMQISPQGRLSWRVPLTWRPETMSVWVSVRDAGGQAVLHTFSIATPDQPGPGGQPSEAARLRIEEYVRRLQDMSLTAKERESEGRELRFELQRLASRTLPPGIAGGKTSNFTFHSKRPNTAYRNKVYTHQMVAKSPAGPVTYLIESGPEGLTLDKDGNFTWHVPADYPRAEVYVGVLLMDPKYETLNAGFTLFIKD